MDVEEGKYLMVTDRKMAILDSFIKLVSRFGMEKTTMQDVAKEAGISVGVIYKDFANKEDLINAYIYNLIDDLVTQCRQLIREDQPAHELLHDFIIGYFKIIGIFLEENFGFFQLISESSNGKKFFQKGEMYRGLVEEKISELIRKIIEKGNREQRFSVENPSETAVLIWHSFVSYTLQMTFQMKSIETVLPQVEKMYRFIVRALET